jgi:hypothetical protein
MNTIHSISVTEALEQLRYPSFFDGAERYAAYKHVMIWGTPEDRLTAQHARLKYPFEEQPQEAFSLSEELVFPS